MTNTSAEEYNRLIAKKPSKRGLGEEDRMHKDFAGMIRQYDALGLLNCCWWTYDASGEYRTEKTGSLLKAKGLMPGRSDYTFKRINAHTAYFIYIEFKTKKGTQSDFQKKFENSCGPCKNEEYYLVRSVEEAINILKSCGVIVYNDYE